MIFKREVLKSQKSLWIWVAVIGGFIFLMLSIYPEFAKNQEELEKLMEIYPESIMKAFNIDQLGMTTVLGFYAIEGYLFVTLFGSIYAAIMASSMLVKEESDKTVEFLLSKPVTRGRVVAEKLLAIGTNLVIFNAAITVITLIGFKVINDSTVDSKTFILLALAPLLLHFTFAAIAYMISSILRKSRLVMSISLGLVLITYFFDIVNGISEKFESLKYFTPFEYVDAAYIIQHVEIKPLYLLLMFIIISLSVVAAFIIYRKKDIAV